MSESLESLLLKFDYVRLTLPDLNGIHVSKLVPTRHRKQIVSGNCTIYSGVIALGPRTEPVEIKEVWDRHLANARMIPIPETFHPLPWANNGNQEKGKRICEVFCELMWPVEKTLIEAHPRVTAGRQIERLNQMGYTLYSAFEPEMRAFQMDSFKTITEGSDSAKTDLLSMREKFFMDLDQMLLQVSIDIQDFCIENGEGQLETPLMPEWGIKSADSCFLFKQALREIARNHGFQISFMTKPLPKSTSSGFHFNHSLWRKDESGGKPKCVMFDENNKHGLSQTALHWMGGILHHLKAIMAICSPTVNCYRRLRKGLTPSYANWNVDDRFSSVRAKVQDEKSTYLENRIPSSASNPYLVLAATVAAGIDGINRKLDPPPPGSNDLGEVPRTLSEALDCLEKDSEIREILGEQFVDWFLKVKRGSDLKELASVDLSKDDEESLFLERKEYFRLI